MLSAPPNVTPIKSLLKRPPCSISLSIYEAMVFMCPADEGRLRPSKTTLSTVTILPSTLLSWLLKPYGCQPYLLRHSINHRRQLSPGPIKYSLFNPIIPLFLGTSSSTQLFPGLLPLGSYSYWFYSPLLGLILTFLI